MKDLKLKYQPIKFNSLSLASSSLTYYTKRHGIILGDDEKYWVVCMADFERLLKAGYEAAK